MMSEHVDRGIGEGPAKVISVSLPEGTVQALRDATGNRGISALVAAAVERELRDRATAAYIAEFEREHGAFTEDEKQAADALWAEAERRETQWREAG
jgi:hypothetical protein